MGPAMANQGTSMSIDVLFERIDSLGRTVSAEIQGLGKRLDQLKWALGIIVLIGVAVSGYLANRVDGLDDSTSAALVDLSGRVGKVEGRLNGVETRLTGIETALTSMQQDLSEVLKGVVTLQKAEAPVSPTGWPAIAEDTFKTIDWASWGNKDEPFVSVFLAKTTGNLAIDRPYLTVYTGPSDMAADWEWVVRFNERLYAVRLESVEPQTVAQFVNLLSGKGIEIHTAEPRIYVSERPPFEWAPRKQEK